MKPQIRIIYKLTSSEFSGRYKNHNIQITRNEGPQFSGQYDISVQDDDGYYAYDGCWGDFTHTMQDAILQACKGSLLC